jgi:hypothetical protein
MLVLLLTLLIYASCKKTVTPNPIPAIEQLPPATQEGKNTCGFLVNGKVWLPKGRVGNGSPNLKWWYDPGYHNGTFNINGYRYDKSEGDKFTSFVIAIDNFSSPGIFYLNTAGRVCGYSDYNKNCIYYREDTISRGNNHINITKFDLQSGIVAGTFEFTLAKDGCDTIRITQGRFDIKL